MTQTLEQKIADTEAKLARLRQKGRQLENGQKIILGGLLLNAAKTDPKMRQWLIAQAARAVTRDVDLQRLAPVLAELTALDEPALLDNDSPSDDLPNRRTPPN